MSEHKFQLGDVVVIAKSANPDMHQYPSRVRFRAFRDARIKGHIVDIANAPDDPHPIRVEFADNALYSDALYLWWDELKRVRPKRHKRQQREGA